MRHPFPISFDIDGRARIQYLVRDDFARGFDTPSACHATDPACVVHVQTDDHSAYLGTVLSGFGIAGPRV